MKQILWVGAGIGAATYLLFNAPAIAQFVSLFRAVGPGFGW
jgi:hypothetical protein